MGKSQETSNKKEVKNKKDKKRKEKAKKRLIKKETGKKSFDDMIGYPIAAAVTAEPELRLWLRSRSQSGEIPVRVRRK